MAELRSRMSAQAEKALPVLATLMFLSFPVAMGPTNALLPIFLIAWIFSGKYREHWLAIRANPVVMWAVALYVLILLGVAWSEAPPKDIALHLSKYAKLLFIALLFPVICQRDWQRRCMQAFSAAMLFILASTWLNVWFVLPWSKTQTPGWGVTHHVIGDYITQNVMMAFFVLLCLVYAHAQKNLAKRLAWAAVALLAAISITHLSEGRTGYLLLATSLVIFGLGALKGRALWLTLAGMVLAMGAMLMSSQVLVQRFEKAVAEFEQSDADNQSSIGHRLYNYQKSLQLIGEKPLAGWGTGAYHTQMCRVVEEPEWCEVFSWHPHNQFLFFGVGHGVPGMLLYAALIAAMIRLALRDPEAGSRTLLLGLA